MSEEVKKSFLKKGEDIIKYSLGIDVGKENLDVCFSTISAEQHIRILGTTRFPNTSIGHLHLYEWILRKKKSDKILVCTMEATGIYYEGIALFLNSKEIYVSVVLPNRAKQYLRFIGQKSKNDKLDTVGLSRMGAEQKLDQWKRPDDLAISLRQLTRFCESCQVSRTALSNQLEAFQCSGYDTSDLEKMISNQIQLLDVQISELKKKVELLIESKQDIKQKVDNIAKIKGLGIYTIAVILSETSFFEMFYNVRQLASYSGYDVVDNQSGKRVGHTRISKKGNTHIRRALHMPALQVILRKEPHLTALWNRVYERSKKKMIAYVAVQRKLLLLIYILWKKGIPYEPNYYSINI